MFILTRKTETKTGTIIMILRKNVSVLRHNAILRQRHFRNRYLN